MWCLERAVALACTVPAQRYGLSPHKGTIAVGADADLTIWDLAREVTVTFAMQQDRTDDTPYEGRRIRGWADLTMSRGTVVYRAGEPLVEPGRGRLAHRRPGTHSRPARV